MKINLDAGAFRAWLDDFEDAEQLQENEYQLDLMEHEPPLSLEISLEKGEVNVLAALELCYSDELDGWYLGEKIKDPAYVAEAIGQVFPGKDR